MYEVNPLIFIYARYADGVWSGIIQECSEPEPREFFSKTYLIERIGGYAAKRPLVADLGDYYKPNGIWADAVIPRHMHGGLSFWIEIMACQHGTWQGRVTYKGDRKFFASESEFFTRIENAYATKIKNAASLEQKRKTYGRF